MTDKYILSVIGAGDKVMKKNICPDWIYITVEEGKENLKIQKSFGINEVSK